VWQFLDVGSAPGTGPGADALHQTVQEAAPGAKLVCCDRDPLVHAHAALDGSAAGGDAHDGTLALVHADLGDPERILDAPGLSDTIDLGHPVALSVSSVPSGPGPYESVQTLLGALPAGSRLVLTHTTADFREAARFFDGLEAAGSGLVTLPGGGYAGVARKP
jgi:S-adenosyl methyltransferase